MVSTFLSKNKFPLKKNATRKKEHAFDIKGYSIMVYPSFQTIIFSKCTLGGLKVIGHYVVQYCARLSQTKAVTKENTNETL